MGAGVIPKPARQGSIAVLLIDSIMSQPRRLRCRLAGCRKVGDRNGDGSVRELELVIVIVPDEDVGSLVVG